MSWTSYLIDAVVSAIGKIADAVIYIISNIPIVGTLFMIIGKIIQVIMFSFTLIEIFIAIIFSPWLLLMYILGFGLFYAAATATTRRELVTNLVRGYYVFTIYGFRVFSSVVKMALPILQTAARVIVHLIQAIIDML